VRVGVIGCGLIAQVMHLHYLRELSDRFEIAALCDISPGTARAVARAYGVERHSTDWRELIASELDAVMVLTNASHAPPAIAAARRGLHVFVEKPMCFTLREADEMIAACREANVTLTVGYHKRFDPAYRLAAERLREMPQLRYVRVTTLEAPVAPYVSHYPLLRVDDVPAAVLERAREERAALIDEALPFTRAADLRRAYQELLLDSAVHELNLLRSLLGDPAEISSVDFWDEGRSMHAVFAYAEERRAAIGLVWLPHLAHYSQELAFYAPDRRMILRFPSPFLRSEPTILELEDEERGLPWRHEVVASHEEAFKLELRGFYESMTEGKAPLTSGEEARYDVAFCVALVKAAQTRREAARR